MESYPRVMGWTAIVLGIVKLIEVLSWHALLMVESLSLLIDSHIADI